MDIIISGLGSVGATILDELSTEGRHNIVVIDTNGAKVEKAVNEYDVKGVIGNCASTEILKEAGISGAELLIATTADDELNILCCIIANRLGAKKTIARVSKPEYRGLFENDGDLGLNLMVNPQYEAAMEISRMLRFPSAITVNKFSDGKVELVEFRVPSNSPLIGIPLKNLNKSFDAKVLICAAQRDGKAIIPTGDFVIRAEDRLFLTATTKNINLFFKQLGWNKSAKDVMIVGCSTTAYYLCEEIERLGNIHAKVIDRNKKKCMQFSEEFSKIDVICGDGTDQELLLDEGLADTDAFVALGSQDEQNIIMSMFANSRGVSKVIPKIDQLSYYDMLQRSGIYSAVSTKNSTADEIVRFVRTMGTKGGSSVQRLFQIIDGLAEILEFHADEFKEFGVPIRDLDLRKNLLVAGIIRDGMLITPTGQDVIEKEDHVIIVTKDEGLSSLNDILNG